MKKVFVYLYYANYHDDLTNLDKIDYLNLSFGKIEKKEQFYLLNIDNIKETLFNIRKQIPNLKIVLSIGCWGCDGFSESVEDDLIRKAFITSIINIVKEYNLSGVDIDWEYPTVTNNLVKGRLEDKHNYTILLKELKEELIKINSNLILSAAVPCTTKFYEVKEINKYLDYLHIMSYDLDYGSDVTVHLTPLYKSNHTLSSANDGVNNWISEGFEKEKIVIGSAFYVRYCETEGMIGSKLKSFKTMSYKNYQKLNINEYFDKDAEAYYGYQDNVFYSFDNPKSINEKINYIKKNNLAGIMCWEYNQDSDNHDLLNAMLKTKEL